MSVAGACLRAKDFGRWLPVRIGYDHGPRVASRWRTRWVILLQAEGVH